jgi:predicted regulator of Ras-like GTPase activity (Roadblock/LC7/MglB family)
MKQYSKELKMGELESISFSVEQGTFQIYNVGIIYFAVLAKPTATLPKENLKLIVRELARHTR